MQYPLAILFAVAVLCVQALLIILKLTGEFTDGGGLILMPSGSSGAVDEMIK